MMAMKPARRAKSSSPGNEMSVTDALRMTAACKMRQMCSDICPQLKGECDGTYDQTSTAANNEHWPSRTGPWSAFGVTPVVARTLQEEVGNAQAYNGDDEVEDGPSERNAMIDIPGDLR